MERSSSINVDLAKLETQVCQLLSLRHTTDDVQTAWNEPNNITDEDFWEANNDNDAFECQDLTEGMDEGTYCLSPCPTSLIVLDFYDEVDQNKSSTIDEEYNVEGKIGTTSAGIRGSTNPGSLSDSASASDAAVLGQPHVDVRVSANTKSGAENEHIHADDIDDLALGITKTSRKKHSLLSGNDRADGHDERKKMERVTTTGD